MRSRFTINRSSWHSRNAVARNFACEPLESRLLLTVSPLFQGEIHGAVYEDVAADGERNSPTDPGLAGWTVFLDRDADGQLDQQQIGSVAADDLPDQTVIDASVLPGATLTVVSGGGIPDEFSPTPLGMIDPDYGEPSNHVLGVNVSGILTHLWSPQQFELRIDFAQPVSWLSIDAICDDFSGAGAHGILRIFAADGSLLSTLDTEELQSGTVFAMRLERPLADIDHAIVTSGGEPVNGIITPIKLDNLAFGDSELSTTTGQQGQYAFTGLDPGNYQVATKSAEGWQAVNPEPPIFPVSLNENQSELNVDFGNRFVGAQILGNVFADDDSNGLRGAGELGLASWIVFLDADNDHQLDEAETFATTDAGGDFTLSGLEGGVYNVATILPPGWTRSSPPEPGTRVVAVESNQTLINVNFGNRLVPQAGTIQGTVWHDTNADGDRDPGEEALAGHVQYLDLDGDGQLDFHTLEQSATDTPVSIPDVDSSTSQLVISGGLGSVVDLDVVLNISHADQQTLHVTLVGPGNRLIQLFNAVGDPLIENFVGTILDDEADVDISAGAGTFTGRFRPQMPLSALDGIDPDGTWKLIVRDDNPDSFSGVLNQWSLRLALADEPVAVSDQNGEYEFVGVAAGFYELGTVPFKNWGLTLPATGSTRIVTVAADQTLSDVDFGARTLPRFVAGSPLGTVKSALSSIDVGFSDPIDPSSFSVADDVLSFTGPDNVDLRSRISATEWINSSTLRINFAPLRADGAYAIQLGPNILRAADLAAMDQDQDGVLGEADHDRFTITFALDLAEIQGIKFEDVNGNGTQDTGELGLAGWTIYADLNTNNLRDLDEPAAVTDASGFYRITGLEANSYQINEVPQEGWQQTSPGGKAGSPVLITEIDLGDIDSIEVQNVSDKSIDTTGWRIFVSDLPYFEINSVNPVIAALPNSLAPGQTLFRAESGSSNLFGGSINWANLTGGTGWVMVLDANGNVVDWVGWGWNLEQLGNFDATGPGFHVAGLNGIWSGNSIPVPGNGTIQRIGNADTNTAANFRYAPPSAAGQNALLTLPFSGLDIQNFQSVSVVAGQTVSNVNFGNQRTAADLVGTSFAIADPSAVWGKTVAVNYTLRNQGGTDAGAFQVDVRLNSGQAGVNQPVVASFSVPGLAKGASVSGTVNVTLPGAPGRPPESFTEPDSVTLDLAVDANNAVSEVNESNNSSRGSGVDQAPLSIVRPDLPNLLATSFQVIDTPQFWGDETTIQYTVSNLGLGVAGAFEIDLRLSANNLISSNDTPLVTDTILGLAPGQTQTRQLTVRLPGAPGSPPPGFKEPVTAFLGLRVDALDRFAETNESDNSSSGTGLDLAPIVIGAGLTGRPDVVAQSITLPSTAHWGDTIAVQYSLINPSQVSAGKFTVEVRLSTNNLIGSGDLLVGSFEVNGLAAGAQTQGSLSITLPGSATAPPPGFTAVDEVFVGLRVDSTDVLEENNEFNNSNVGDGIDVATLDIIAPTTPLAADLAAIRFRVLDDAARWGDQVTITYEIENRGTAASGAFAVEVRVSSNTSISSDDVLLFTIPQAALAAGEHREGTALVRLPGAPGQPPGSTGLNSFSEAQRVHLGLRLDSAHQVNELNELNNANLGAGKDRTDLLIVAPAAIALPDLAGAGVSIDEPSVQWGQAITVHYAVVNLGRTAAAASQGFLRLSNNEVFSDADPLLALVNLPALAVGARYEGTATVSLPGSASAPPFNFTASDNLLVGLQVDVTKQVTERDESNNSNRGSNLDFAPLLVTAGASGLPDLIGSVFHIAEDSVTWGSTVTIDYVIANTGIAAAGAFQVQVRLSSTGVQGNAEPLLATFTVPGLAAGNRSEGTLRVVLPGSANDPPPGFSAPQLVTLGLRIDADGAIVESDEANNSNRGDGLDRAAISILADDPSSLFDLTGVAFDLISSTAQWGGEITVRYAIANQGEQDTGPFDIEFRLSRDSTIGGDDLLLPGVPIRVDSLAGGATLRGTKTIVLPGSPKSPPTGFNVADDLFVGTRIDPNNAIDESDELNNANRGPGFDLASLKILSEDTPPLPDLVGAAFEVVPKNAASNANPAVQWGDEVTVRYRIRNAGELAANATVAEIRLVPGAAFVTGTRLDTLGQVLATIPIAALAAGATSEGTIDLRLPGSPGSPPAGFTEPDQVVLGLLLDSSSLIDEQIETNNSGVAVGQDLARVAVAKVLESEPNDQFASADRMHPSVYKLGVIGSPTDRDNFQIDLTEAGQLVLQLAGANSSALAGRLQLFDALGNALAVADADLGTGSAASLAQFAPAGRYYVTVSGRGSGSSAIGGYRLTSSFAATLSPLVDLPTDGRPESVVNFDVNHDQILDLITANSATHNVSIYLGRGDGTFSPPLEFAVGLEPSDLAVGDFDNDSHPDLAVTNQFSDDVSLLFGRGDGTFEAKQQIRVGDGPRAITAGDFNRDGKTDLAIANGFASSVSLLLGMGNGVFAPATTVPVHDSPRDLAVGDFNRDGTDDLAVADFAANRVTIINGSTTSQFFDPDRPLVELSVGAGPRSIVVADFDGNGRADLATANQSSNDISLLMNFGGGFEAERRVAVGVNPIASLTSPFGLVVGDFDQDGFTDLATVNHFSSDVSVMLGMGDGSFHTESRFNVGSAPVALTVGDFNSDERLDVATTNLSSITVLPGLGDGRLRDAPSATVGNNPSSLAAGDFNGDGRLDLVTTNEDSADASVLLGLGDGALSRQARFQVGDTPVAITVADLNADGRMDLATANGSSESVSLLLGLGNGQFQSKAGTTGVGVRPVAVVSGDFNRDGIADLATANRSSANISLLMGLGGGRYQEIDRFDVGAAPGALAAGDINRDAKLDLISLSEDGGRVTISFGVGDGHLRERLELRLGDNAKAIAVADVNGDNRLDLLTALDTNEVAVLLGNGDGTFGDESRIAVGVSPRALLVQDFDRDGFVDFATANYFSEDVSLVLGLGDGTFAPEVRSEVGGNPLSLVAGDFSGSGRTDLATTVGNTVSVLLSTSADQFATPDDATTAGFLSDPILADLNGDQFLDSVVLRRDGKILFRSGRTTQSGAFAPPIVINPEVGARAMTLLQSSDQVLIAAIDQSGDRISLYTTAGIRVPGPALSVAPLSVRLVAANLNGDAREDLIAVSEFSGDVSILLSTAGTNFQSLAPIHAGVGLSDLQVLDVDHSSTPDIVLANQASSELVVLLNPAAAAGQSTLRYRTGTQLYALTGAPLGQLQTRSGQASTALATTDTNGDGLNDLVVTQRGANGFSLLTALAAGGFAAPIDFQTGSEPTAIWAGDLNGDNKIDLAVLLSGANRVAVYLGNGNNGFEHSQDVDTGTSPSGISAADVNRDGRADLVVANEFGDLLTLLGYGNGTFQPFTHAGRNVALTTADVDGDGQLDQILADENLDRLTVQFGSSAQKFESGRDDGLLAPGAVSVLDINGDTIPDIIVANSGSNNILVYLGKKPDTGGAGQPAAAAAVGAQASFESARTFFAGTSPTGITSGDFNGDGLTDLAVANEGSNDISVLLGNKDSLLEPGVRLVAGAGPAAIVTDDFNGDKIPDLLVSNAGSNNLMMMAGLGNGFFNDQSPIVLPTGVNPGTPIIMPPTNPTGNPTGFGGISIVVPNYGSNSLTIYGGLSTDFRRDIASGGIGPIAGVFGDFNRDGFSDLIIAHNGDGAIGLLLGGSTGLSLSESFFVPNVQHPTALALAKFDTDGSLDLWIADEGDELVSVFELKVQAPATPKTLLSLVAVGFTQAAAFLATFGLFQAPADELNANVDPSETTDAVQQRGEDTSSLVDRALGLALDVMEEVGEFIEEVIKETAEAVNIADKMVEGAVDLLMEVLEQVNAGGAAEVAAQNLAEVDATTESQAIQADWQALFALAARRKNERDTAAVAVPTDTPQPRGEITAFAEIAVGDSEAARAVLLTAIDERRTWGAVAMLAGTLSCATWASWDSLRRRRRRISPDRNRESARAPRWNHG